MKKQFFRVKQLADQTFSRAGKTEALSDDLQGAEKRVESIKNICMCTGKKLSNPNIGHELAREKRLKKTSEYTLGFAMLELLGSEEENLLRHIGTECGKLQLCLANAVVDHDMNVETKIAAPLVNICDNDYPNIMKLKKNLNKLILDMDSARARYITATTKHSGTGNQGSKADSIKDELEEAETKVEQCRDNLACEMLQLISRESEISKVFLEYVKLQRNYHQTAITVINEIVEEMEDGISNSYIRPVFGTPLEEHLKVTARKIAYPIELCVCGLLELGIAEEGLFRVAPGASKLRRMKLSLDANCLDFVSALQIRDPHVFAGVIKSYLRELPEPLLTHKLYNSWMSAAVSMYQGNKEESLNGFWNILHNLPQANFDNLQYIIKFLSSLASNKQANKMTPQNIAIVIAPNIIWSPVEDTNNIGHNMTTANYHNGIVETLISYCDWFFPNDIDFYVTLPKEVGQSYLNGNGVSGESQTQPSEEVSTINRTQSNDSLSDPSSPPHGSPKPAVRFRKHKSLAPNPPGMHNKELTKSVEKPKDKPVLEKEKTDDKRPPPPKETLKNLLKEDTIKKNIEIKQLCNERRDSLSSEVNRVEFEQYDGARGSGNDLSRRTSKSGEDIRRPKVEEGAFCTLRKPPRPMPRTSLGDMRADKPLVTSEKPTIPDRPPQLQRPLSFRLPKHDSYADDRNISLERTHIYNVDKQQATLVQVTNDNKIHNDKILSGDSPVNEKPEKPKKPESLMAGFGHQRAASEGSIIDTGVVSMRQPRPTPPPPPVTTPPLPPTTTPKKENTDL